MTEKDLEIQNLRMEIDKMKKSNTAHWVEVSLSRGKWRCSRCDQLMMRGTYTEDGLGLDKYCRSCGAEMK